MHPGHLAVLWGASAGACKALRWRPMACRSLLQHMIPFFITHSAADPTVARTPTASPPFSAATCAPTPVRPVGTEPPTPPAAEWVKWENGRMVKRAAPIGRYRT